MPLILPADWAQVISQSVDDRTAAERGEDGHASDGRMAGEGVRRSLDGGWMSGSG